MQFNKKTSQLIPTVLTVFFLLFFIEAAVTAQSQQGLSPEQVAELKSVGDVVLADDGHHIAYTLRVQADPTQKNEPASYHLYVYDRERETSVPYFTDASVSSVHFRPEHGSITFLTRKDGDSSTGLYEMPLDGGTAQKIYSFETSISEYDWARTVSTSLLWLMSHPKRSSQPCLTSRKFTRKTWYSGAGTLPMFQKQITRPIACK